jgi:small-conductance mechanosensitive channel
MANLQYLLDTIVRLYAVYNQTLRPALVLHFTHLRNHYTSLDPQTQVVILIITCVVGLVLAYKTMRAAFSLAIKMFYIFVQVSLFALIFAVLFIYNEQLLGQLRSLVQKLHL